MERNLTEIATLQDRQNENYTNQLKNIEGHFQQKMEDLQLKNDEKDYICEEMKQREKELKDEI